MLPNTRILERADIAERRKTILQIGGDSDRRHHLRAIAAIAMEPGITHSRALRVINVVLQETGQPDQEQDVSADAE